MFLSLLSTPVLIAGIILLAVLLALLILITASSASAARRLLRLLESLQHLLHGTCPACGHLIKVSNSHVKRIRKR
jgi:hypothetical protein